MDGLARAGTRCRPSRDKKSASRVGFFYFKSVF